ncbi:MAG: UDP-4-amino-4-deoxy-L-arabinose aminotransferase [Acidobacteria bacterium]|nr:UDP-4-amino-4-deoxy-L-arabinose aminotransferase [Acidobacteriota bacterium]
MRTTFLPFSKPNIVERDIQAVTEVLRSGWITTGPVTAQFEQAVQEYCGAQNALAVCSATGAMHLMLRALGIGPGDEVITPSLTWVSTVNLIVLAGAKPVFADIDRHTLMIDRNTVEPLITRRTKLIIPVHYAGAALDMDPLTELAIQHDIALVEDAAHAIGTQYKQRLVGSTGTTIFSFHPIKNITTGEGGLVTTEDGHLLERLRRLKFHGLGVDAFDRSIQGRSPQAEVLEPGFKYNLTDLAAALGLSQLGRIETLIEKRTELAEHYLKLLSDVPQVTPLGLPDYPMRHAWHLFIVRLNLENTGLDRLSFMEALKRRNIGTGIHFKAVHQQKYYRDSMANLSSRLPNTEWNSERIVSLPLFPDMRLEDVETVVQSIKEVLR